MSPWDTLENSFRWLSGSQAGGVGFQRDTALVDLSEAVGIQWIYHESGVRGDDQLVLLQHAQGFPDRASADSDLLRQFIVADLFAGRESAG